MFRKLGCLAHVFTPTFPIVRLGSKGSTSAIVTIGSSELGPQTGWRRKLALLLFSIMVGTQPNSWVQKIYCTSLIVTMSNRRKVSVEVLVSSKMLLTLRQWYSISSLSTLCLLQPYGLIAWSSKTPSILSTCGVHDTFRPLAEEGEADGRLRRV